MQRVINLSQHSFVRYVIVGGSTFAIDLLLLIGIRELGHLDVVVAATISYWSALFYNFIVNKFWTFGNKENTRHHAFVYAGLVVFNYGASIGIIWTLGHIGIAYYVAKILAVVLAMAWNYIAYKKLVFV